VEIYLIKFIHTYTIIFTVLLLVLYLLLHITRDQMVLRITFKRFSEDLSNAEVSAENIRLNIFSGEHPLKYLYAILVPILKLIKNAEIRLSLLKNPLKSSYIRLLNGTTPTTVLSSKYYLSTVIIVTLRYQHSR
jgi:hypothetical protein